MKFNVTFDVVTEESAQDGDTAESGFISQDVSLSAAVADVLDSFSNTVDGRNIETGDRWISVQWGMDWQSGDYESRCLHRPANCTNASWSRICRLVEAR